MDFHQPRHELEIDLITKPWPESPPMAIIMKPLLPPPWPLIGHCPLMTLSNPCLYGADIEHHTRTEKGLH